MDYLTTLECPVCNYTRQIVNLDTLNNVYYTKFQKLNGFYTCPECYKKFIESNVSQLVKRK